MPQLKVGAAKANVTPPVGCPMSGYAGRKHGAVGVHDDLFVRAFYLDDGQTPLAIVSCDLIDMCQTGMKLFEEVAAEQTGLPPEALFIANSHTHSGPSTRYAEDSELRSYIEALYAIISGAIYEAREAMRPAALSIARREVQCGVNRRERTADGAIILGVNPDGPVDRHVDIFRFDDDSGEVIGVLLAHAVHNVTMGSDNYLISGDLGGAAEAFVERNTGCIAGFLNGCCGNINAHPRGEFAHVDMLGARLGAAVVQGLTEAAAPTGDVTLGSLRHEVALPLDPVPPLEEAERDLKEAEALLGRAEHGEAEEELSVWRVKRIIDHAKARHELAAIGETSASLTYEIAVVTMNDIALVGYPSEVFFEIGEAVREGSPFGLTRPLSHVNGAHGYIPIREAFADGGYEVTARIHHKGLGITPDAGDALAEASLAALKKAKSF
jgi:hypothetical protein